MVYMLHILYSAQSRQSHKLSRMKDTSPVALAAAVDSLGEVTPSIDTIRRCPEVHAYERDYLFSEDFEKV